MVSQPQVYVERQKDKEFAAQWNAAIAHFADLLEARATQLSLEGNIEPVFYMGVPVAYIRKFDTKLVIEMLRAYKPERYKTPGMNVNIGTKGDVFVLTEEQRHILMDYQRRWVLDHPPPGEEPSCSDMAATSPTTCDENGEATGKNSLGNAIER